MNEMTDQEEDLQWFRSFVEGYRWRFARTYVESYPHEYTLEHPDDQVTFSRAIQCIECWGVVESFWSARRKYLYVDERKYWHMGQAGSDDPEKRPTLINRTWLDVTGYRTEAARLGYDGERLEHLLGRWKTLLEKAKRL